MRSRVWVLLVAAAVLVQGTGCCRCCRCFAPRESRLPPPDLSRDDRIPPAALPSSSGTAPVAPAALPKPNGEGKPTGAYGGS